MSVAGSSGGTGRSDKEREAISRCLAWTLRYGANTVGLEEKEGFFSLRAVLETRWWRARGVTEEDIMAVVFLGTKDRYEMRAAGMD